ncbi:pyruvate dehydrogenase E1 component alpha subunit [Agrococcus baldri]|uniref:2-oxoisovalerate dehydrogenase subunit alpha n=1 Tax=Agrococcus baldri TaxID=153730 RepID=A0AA94HMF2_9MICO|nr:thiamine pyrophosphate-dependent enzyme [Agrococcus baldri]SFS10747.1 pyruvate dehydrogenase E1 component alpha subunit [Agrococcus baldri]
MTPPAVTGTAAATQPIRLLDAEGRLVESEANAPWHELAAQLSTEDRLAMHGEMLRTRRFDIEAGHLQRQGKLGLWVPSIGQEGAQVGAVWAAREQDTLFPSYREHLIALHRGATMDQIIDIFRGARHAGWNPLETRGMRIYSLVIATHALHSTGYAMGIRLDGKSGTGDASTDEAVMAFYGDGAASQGDASEGLVFAASYEAPIVFFVQNNKWAISVPSTRQSRFPLHERARGFGLDAALVDGNDPLASFAVTRRMLDAARQGAPGYIEADTYRMGAHTTSDDPTRYRTSEEEESWRRRDPIARLAAHLREQGVAEAVLAEQDVEATELASDLRRRTLEAATAISDDIFDHVYSDPHPLVTEQKRQLAEFEASFGGEA